jgi:hypothetical protein
MNSANSAAESVSLPDGISTARLTPSPALLQGLRPGVCATVPQEILLTTFLPQRGIRITRKEARKKLAEGP